MGTLHTTPSPPLPTEAVLLSPCCSLLIRLPWRRIHWRKIIYIYLEILLFLYSPCCWFQSRNFCLIWTVTCFFTYIKSLNKHVVWIYRIVIFLQSTKYPRPAPQNIDFCSLLYQKFFLYFMIYVHTSYNVHSLSMI